MRILMRRRCIGWSVAPLLLLKPPSQNSNPFVVAALRALFPLQAMVYEVVVLTFPATSTRPTTRFTLAAVAAEGSASPGAAA